MWLPSKNTEPKREGGNGLVAVAIDKDKGSQNALKWAIDHLLQRGQTVLLIHVKLRLQSLSSSPTLPSSWTNNNDMSYGGTEPDSITKELFLPFRCFCTRKDIQCRDIMLEDVDVAKALIEYVSQTAIENLVIGSPAKSTFLRRFKAVDIPSTALKGAPDFCNVFVVSKGKVQSMRSASRPAPAVSPLHAQLPKQSNTVSDLLELHSPQASIKKAAPPLEAPRKSQDQDEVEFVRSPFTRERYMGRSYGDTSQSDSNESYVTSGRESIDRLFSSFYNNLESGKQSPLPISRSRTEGELDINHSFESLQLGRRSVGMTTPSEFSAVSQDSERLSTATQAKEDVENEMRRLKLELKQTMEMYSTACKEALSATKKAKELQRWKVEEEQKFEEARLAEEAALAIVEQEKAKSRAAIEAAQAAKRIAELEAEKRIQAERKALKEAEEKKKAFDALAQTDVRYRRYSIDEIEAATEYFSESRKIGEGGYGPVYKCFLDHTSVAVKVLRPDASQGRSQFQQEVEVLSCIRHPNMVLLLGACPEYGCLVYEFMANGSLEDRLFRRGNTRSLPWQIRFKIAAEIGTGLLFLHQTKPEPLVHRDLKPANILLDRNYVSKISDVGLARLVPPSVIDNVTQYRMTSTAGTFCYIDPEYQQTGMLGVKSDIYSLGIMFLQMITAKPPMGLTHIVERAIEKDTFVDILDRTVPDWPVKEALSFAKMALSCAELRRKDRPDLGKSILPELNRLRLLAEESMQPMPMGRDANPSPNHSQVSLQLETMVDHQPPLSCESSRNPSCTL